MPNQLPEKTVQYHGLLTESARWTDFKHRPNDIFICTPPKCGTTWMQAICALLVFQTPELEVNPATISPWIDANLAPIEDILALLDSQTHRRIIKTHTPLDGIPYFEECQYICVYRDPRDAYFSLRNHVGNMKLELTKGMLDTPPREGFQNWIVEEFTPGEEGGPSLGSVVHHLKTFQRFDSLPNVALYHYNDLIKDLNAGMHQISDQLGIEVDAELLPRLAKTASFGNMKENAQRFAPGTEVGAWHDNARFFNKGSIGQWRDVISEADDEKFQRALATHLDPDLAQWLLVGRDRL